mmetsp:Transcript_935/g.3217  ORF Transcript_935/g.3217 Transcript_935/m.3217 type:complete len:254 (-) Transcript_935:157-918(-)
MFRLNLARGFSSIRSALTNQSRMMAAQFHTSLSAQSDEYRNPSEKAQHNQSSMQSNSSFQPNKGDNFEQEAAQSIQSKRRGKRQRLENQPDEMVTNSVNPLGHMQSSAKGMGESADLRQGGLLGRTPTSHHAKDRRENYLKDVQEQTGDYKATGNGSPGAKRYDNAPTTARPNTSVVGNVTDGEKSNFKYAEYKNIRGDKEGIKAFTDGQEQMDDSGASNTTRPSFETGTPGVMRPSSARAGQRITEYPTRAS